jgi:DNA polymerase-1
MTVYGKRAGKAAERSIFRADDGEVLVAIDADQVDARCVAVMCQDPDYAELFQPGRDLHSEVAWRVFQNPECRAEMDRNGGRCECPLRDRAKVLGHGFNYGMGPGAMARQHGLDIAVTTAFCEGMTKAFPLLARWKEQVRAAAGALGFDQVCPPSEKPYRILRNLFGRTVRVERNRAYTQATAQLGQSMTRDVMAHAILKLGREGYRDRIRTIVHDELVLSIPAGEDAQGRAQSIADGMAFLMGKRGIITGEPTEDDGIVLRIGFGCSRVSEQWGGCYGEQYEIAA